MKNEKRKKLELSYEGRAKLEKLIAIIGLIAYAFSGLSIFIIMGTFLAYLYRILYRPEEYKTPYNLKKKNWKLALLYPIIYAITPGVISVILSLLTVLPWIIEHISSYKSYGDDLSFTRVLAGFLLGVFMYHVGKNLARLGFHGAVAISEIFRSSKKT